MSGETVVYRKDYKAPEYLVHDVELDVILDAEDTHVTSHLKISASRTDVGDLILDGEDIVLKEVWLNGKQLKAGEYVMGVPEHKDKLVIPKSLLPPPTQEFEVLVKNTNNPKANLALSGLYKSANLLVTQMEAEGYRRFAYNVDRPDNLSRYKVRVEGDKSLYPVLLSNGDQIKYEEELPNNRHAKTFVDPFKKPTYLFAIIAGPLKSIHDTFTTMATPEEPSKVVDLYVWCDEKYLPQVEWAMECVKKAMKWDEETYGRVYDLRTFSVVAIEDFNAGAMENKSLTTYNVSCVLASPETSPDAAYERVLEVIGHEYFHNWSGDRVTVRDWFQITLKEGFTNFRETSFVRDVFSPGAKRVGDVAMIRASQFIEDAGPMSHPIRPESYVTIDNFYTSTVYDKGSQVIGMLKTLVGAEGFRKGTDLYFSRYDGKAISCDEFRNSIAEANKRDFAQFELWYSQRGTPTLKVHNHHWDSNRQRYVLTVEQQLPANANPDPQGKPQALHIPILVGLIGRASKKDLVKTTLLELTDWKQTFEIENVQEDCVPSFLRDFSAPVKVETFLTKEELGFLSAFDTDSFCAWDAAQSLFKDYIIERAQKLLKKEQVETQLPEHIVQIFKEGLKNRFNDMEFVSCFLALPSAGSLCPEMKPIADPVLLWNVTQWIRDQLAEILRTEINQHFEELWAVSKKTPFAVTKEDVGRRSLQALLLAFATRVPADQTGTAVKRILDFYKSAKCFNDKKVAASLITRFTTPERDEIMADLYKLCKDDPNMLDGWFRTQALASAPDTLDRVKSLMSHPDFKDTTTPNRWRALIGGLSVNTPYFHDRSGEGYKIVAGEVSRFDKFNGYTASAIAKQLIQFANYDDARQKQMIDVLRGLQSGGLSKNTGEVVSRALATVN
eukprot:Gregarina_sp_Pseudo_9__4207@NODE_435_length_2837_cov_39_925304_g411_i0_p1_GENE_NODE_435_length_2837_cov_39_925304_g411_i0NODE_435_length_2837_cov_39_925304_g411_i0_p1_ORF_typecomplete_len897_score274_60DUF3458_C/PF17432_2/1_6e03DUF3458_C/PF17432_2/2_8e75Peptidase_M1/PF01433_20/7_6e56DUF3458/PF11940_8/2_1e25Peptidase_M1_N/PF17900_1/2_5e19Peptidase_M1_N/PF17900_1/9_5e03HCBP_related/PF06594_11/3_4HCBP_related/PF06594_11/5_1e02_NODE_435_length_2837_cov_39_925304_g411_i0592749